MFLLPKYKWRIVKLGFGWTWRSSSFLHKPFLLLPLLLLLLLSSPTTPNPSFTDLAFFDLSLIIQFGNFACLWSAFCLNWGLQESFSADFPEFLWRFLWHEPQMNRDQGPAQASNPNPPPVAKPRESGQPKKADEPLPRQDNASLRTSFDSHQRHGIRGLNSADSHAKPHPVKSSGGVPVDRSPIHPRPGGRGSGSQPSSSDSLQGASGKPRPRTTTRSAPNHKGGGPAVPEFGAWNKDPEQAEGYTDVFNQVLTEKKTPGHNSANTATPTPRRIHKKQTEGNCFSRLFKCFSSSN